MRSTVHQLTDGLFVAALSLALCWTFEARAARLDWPDRPYSYYANEESLRDVLKSLATSHGMPAVISDEIDASVSVNFTSRYPREIFEQLVRAYNLTWYFDGKTLYIYKLDELVSQTIRLNRTSVDAFEQELRELGVYDERFYWRSIPARGLIYVTGPERYITLIKEWVVALDSAPERPQGGAVYTWTDANGITHFSSEPPDNLGRSNLDIDVIGLDQPGRRSNGQ
ncbi:MAG: secretin N-terminal domain-containing protein [Candidatus Competibacterales bacterium]